MSTPHWPWTWISSEITDLQGCLQSSPSSFSIPSSLSIPFHIPYTPAKLHRFSFLDTLWAFLPSVFIYAISLCLNLLSIKLWCPQITEPVFKRNPSPISPRTLFRADLFLLQSLTPTPLSVALSWGMTLLLHKCCPPHILKSSKSISAST